MSETDNAGGAGESAALEGEVLPPADAPEPRPAPGSCWWHPKRRVKGLGAAWNFTMGPALIYEGRRSLDAIAKARDPVVVIAEYIPDEELRKMDKFRVRGFVIEKGSIIDPTYWIYRDENRAAVVAAKDALLYAQNGEAVIVDGVRGVVYFGPSPDTVENYAALRKLGPPMKDPILEEVIRTLSSTIMGTMFRFQMKPPYEFAEQEKLLDIATRARNGAVLTPEEDKWMLEIIAPEMPDLDRIRSGELGGAAPPAEVAAEEAPAELEAPPPAEEEARPPAEEPPADEPPPAAAEDGETSFES